MIFIKKDKRTELEKGIDDHIEVLAGKASTKKELEDVIELMAKRDEIKQKAKFRISPDTVALVIGNLAGIVLILKYEEMNVITSKALNFVLRRV